MSAPRIHRIVSVDSAHGHLDPVEQCAPDSRVRVYVGPVSDDPSHAPTPAELDAMTDITDLITGPTLTFDFQAPAKPSRYRTVAEQLEMRRSRIQRQTPAQSVAAFARAIDDALTLADRTGTKAGRR